MDSEFKPNWVSPPGDTIRDILEERNITKDQFAWTLKLSDQETEDLFAGRVAITTSLARALEKALGGTAGFWLTRDEQYRKGAYRDHA
jgi:HTH-type transcriptional regulator/antitoxin HigA